MLAVKPKPSCKRKKEAKEETRKLVEAAEPAPEQQATCVQPPEPEPVAEVQQLPPPVQVDTPSTMYPALHQCILADRDAGLSKKEDEPPKEQQQPAVPATAAPAAPQEEDEEEGMRAPSVTKNFTKLGPIVFHRLPKVHFTIIGIR